MTMEIVPVPESPWRVYRAPKDVDLANGPWCPMDARVELIPLPDGWACAACGARWDQHGRHGRWLDASTAVRVGQDLAEHAPQQVWLDGYELVVAEPVVGPAAAGRSRRIARVTTATIAAGAVLGGGYAAGVACRPYADAVPDALLWSLSLIIVGLLLTGAGALLAWRWWTSRTGGGAA